jgi:hypothetical protein
MTLGREAPGGRALTVLNVDSAPAPGVVTELKQSKHVLDVTVAKL